MGARSAAATLKYLIKDTFRQARASGVSWMMLAITAICVLLCLSVTVSGDISLKSQGEPVLFRPQPSPDWAPSRSAAATGALPAVTFDPELSRSEGIDTVSGAVTLGFGAVSFPVVREREDAVCFLELLLAGGIAGSLGLLMMLVWTAGFVPSFLQPSAASVLLSKPIARWQLLLGKYVGVLIFVAFQLALFVGLTWLALGVRTHVWDMTYWWCLPLLWVQFAIFYSFSVLAAVVTRSTVSSAFGSLLFWLLAWATNYGCALVRGSTESAYLTSATRWLAEAAYWVFPKPIDAGLILFNALGAHHHFEKPMLFQMLESGHTVSPQLSIVSSLLLAGVLLVVAAVELDATDY